MKMLIKQKYIRKSLIAVLIAFLAGCIIVKHPEKDDYSPVIKLSPKPEIEMSETLIRSEDGDMIAFIPEDWFLMDISESKGPDFIALAVDPEYTMNFLIKYIRKNSQTENIVNDEGLLGLARLSFSRKQRKTGGIAKKIGKYQPIEMGSNEFVKYDYSVTGGSLAAQVAVFKSSLNKYYECALIPVDIKGKSIPSEEERNKIFRSIVSTIKF